MTAKIIFGNLNELRAIRDEIMLLKISKDTKLNPPHRKVICSGPGMNAIDFKMREKQNRPLGKPIIDVIARSLIIGCSTKEHSKKSSKSRRLMAKASRKINRGK